MTTIKVLAFAASGSGSTGGYGSESSGAPGGSVKATIPVTPGEKLAVFVGGEGATAGGFNGGGERRQHRGERRKRRRRRRRLGRAPGR